MFGAVKCTVQVGLNNSIPEILGHFADARPARNTPSEMGHDGGVVDVHVDLTKMIHDLIDHAFDALFVAHVHAYPEGLGEPSKFGCSLSSFFFVDVRDHHLCFVLRKSGRCMAANALRAAGYDNYFSFGHGEPPETFSNAETERMRDRSATVSLRFPK
jgi:hypothetical protein